MSAKLDRALGDIVKGQRAQAKRTRRNPKGVKTGTTVAPVGGVKKTTKITRTTVKHTVPTGPSGAGESKIIVSNLPPDVTESMMKEYFGKTISPVKKVLMTYGPDGKSRGICTIIFNKRDAASKAVKEMNGVKVDNSAMKVEVVLSAHDAPAAVPAKSLRDRISQPVKTAKAQPKPATAVKLAAGRGGKAKTQRGRNAGRGMPKKTAEQLDADMADYFDGGVPAGGDTAMANGGAAAPATNGGDTGMDDEIL